MKSKFLLILIFFSICFYKIAFTSDRFGNERGEVCISSFTASADGGVMIASAPGTNNYTTNIASMQVPGYLYLKSIYCSGVNITTVTFYDVQHFGVAESTRDVFVYVPANPTSILGSYPSQIFFDAYYSSGIAYIKQGGDAPCGIRWDYTTRPKWSDPRP